MEEKEYTLADIAQFTLSEDQLTAYLTFIPVAKNNSIDEKQLMELIKQQGITFGLQQDTIRSFIQDPDLYSKQELVIARGKYPVDGQDSSLEMVFEQQKSDKRPKVKEDGSVDFYSLTEILNVEKGQLLAKKIPPTMGIPGMTVTNKVLKARDGRDFPIKAGKNVVVDKGSQAVYSLIEGQVSITEDGKINVFPVFEVNGDLSFEVGNIDFVGTVVIRGNVPSGFKIKANGDVRITGGVEGVEIEAGGSVTISSGITAQNKGLIFAGQDVRTSFIVNAKVHAQGSVVVTQSVMHSEIVAGDNIECLGQKGLIVGGHLQAGKSLKCRTIGNNATTSTTIEVGGSPKLLNQLKAVQAEIKEIMPSMTKTEQTLTLLDQMVAKFGKLPPDKKEMQLKLANTKIQLERRIRELNSEKREIEEELNQEQLSSVEVSSVVYSGTKIVFGKYVKYVKDNIKGVKFMIDRGEIVARPLI